MSKLAVIYHQTEFVTVPLYKSIGMNVDRLEGSPLNIQFEEEIMKVTMKQFDEECQNSLQ